MDGKSPSYPTETKYFKDINEMKKACVMKNPSLEVKWYGGEGEKSFTGLCQIFTDKTATSLNAKSMTAHAVHVTLLNFKKPFRECLIKMGTQLLDSYRVI